MNKHKLFLYLRGHQALIAVILSIMAALIMCPFNLSARGAVKDAKLKIGASLLTEAHPFYQAIQSSMKAKAEEKGVDLIINIADQDLSKQISHVEDFITQQVDIIILTPVDSKGVKGAVLKAKAASIPVITVDIKAEGVEVDAHIATDNYTGGKIAAEAMAQYLQGRGKVALMTYPEVQSVRDRIDGFKEQAKNYPDLQIVSELPARTREAAKATAEDMFTANKDLAGIFGFGDDMAIAATNVVREQGRDMVVIGFDGLAEAIGFVDQDNAFMAVVKQEPMQMGSQAIELAIELKNGGRIPKESKIVPTLYAYQIGDIPLNLQEKDFGIQLR